MTHQASAMKVRVFNCLPTTLAHYASELSDTLARLQVEVTQVDSRVPIDSSRSIVVRGLSHIRQAREISRSDLPTIVIWPAFGWLDGSLWSRSRSRILEISHDPVPIRRQFLTGRFWNAVAKRSMRVEWLCHTESAANAAVQVIGTRPRIALHPVLSTSPPAREILPGRRGVVSVLGQFKPSRNVDVLREIAETLSPEEYDLQIIGRGWPHIDGWRVTDRFVSEDDLDRALDDSDVVVIPYRKYWQSGIAVRAVERGVSVVGERTEFLTRLLGADYPGLVNNSDSWPHTIAAVANHHDTQTHAAYVKAVDDSWRPIVDLLRSPSHVRSDNNRIFNIR